MANSAQLYDVSLSKKLSWLLRHGANQVDLNLDPEGFLELEAILKLRQFLQYSREDVERVVSHNEKRRFAMKLGQNGNWLIRANQGHSLEVENLDLRPIKNAGEFPTVVHGTRKNLWDTIKIQGLSRMGRQHIHFAAGLPGENTVISGMRQKCTLWIFVDLEKAISGGFFFYLSHNGVILCPGNEEGFLPPAYFSRVTVKMDKKWEDVELQKIPEMMQLFLYRDDLVLLQKLP